MKKDLDKLFSKSIQTYYFLLVLILIIKLLGGNYFEIVQDNRPLNMINDFILYWRLENIWYAITLYIYSVIIIGITCNDCSKNIKKYCLMCMPIIMLLQYSKNYTGIVGIFIDFIYLFILSVIYMKIYRKNNKYYISNYLLIIMFYIGSQILSIILRGCSLTNVANTFYVNTILSLDYLIIMIIVYKLYFMKGGLSLCQVVVSSGSQKLISLKNSLRKSQKDSQNKRKLAKEEKITYMIYFPLYLLWNLFTMFIIICIAMLNDALAEAILITMAFWINKRVFGEPFHFKSVAICFCFSSFVYYVLTRITFHIQTSLFIPIFLGVSLSYVTSHFIKKNYKLYKGMDTELFYNTIRQVTNDELVIKICKEYYCYRYNDIKIANINSYSIDSIRKKRQKVNKDLRNLEK